MRQETLFDLFFKDAVSLHKADGRVFHDIKAQVTANRIVVTNGPLPVEIGDRLIRPLPNGFQEEYVIDECTYQAAVSGLPDRYHLAVHRALSEFVRANGQSSDLKQAESTSHAPPLQSGRLTNAKPGPRPNVELGLRVLRIVERIVAAGHWKDKLDELCEALDEAQIPTPKTWSKRGIKNWADAALFEKELTKKAIQHHLRVARA